MNFLVTTTNFLTHRQTDDDLFSWMFENRLDGRKSEIFQTSVVEIGMLQSNFCHHGDEHQQSNFPILNQQMN
jgi:hypothetical protein